MFTKSRDKASTSSNPFLQANFAPVHEENDIASLNVEGSIPEELNGRFLRIGPNPAASPNEKSYHWFLGTGMVHGLRLNEGRALWYKNNYVLTNDAVGALSRKALPTPRKTRGTSVNTNAICIAGEIYAVVEAGDLPVKLDNELRSVEHSDFNGTLKNGFTAHPHKDPDTGELHALTYEPNKKTIDYIVVDKTGSARLVSRLDAPHQPMIHDTAITPSFVIVLDLPVTFDLMKVMSGTFPYSWNRKLQPRVGLLPRSGDASKIIWFEAPSCYVYHIMNAFEEGNTVVIDVIKNAMDFGADILKRNNKPPRLVRWILDRTTGKLSETQLSEQSVEFPRLNDSYVGKPYRYGYTATLTETLEFGAAYKHDLKNGTTWIHDFGSGRSTLEPVFVPKSDAKAEDDGWILSYVFDANKNRSDVVILDAQNFEGVPVATIQLPVRVPYGFHGNWVGDNELTNHK